MLSKRDNLLETLKKGGKPDRLVDCYTPFKEIAGDPIDHYLRGDRIPGVDFIDPWGTYVSFPKGQVASMPYVTAENQVVKDIEEWQKYLKVPDLRANCSEGWETALASKAAIDTSEYLSLCIIRTGIFEQMHRLMTFEDTLCNLLMYPDEVHELIDALLEYRMEYAKLIVEKLRPEVVLSHDDWGSNDSMFMSPEVWREFFKEPYRRFFQYFHDNGVIVMHHSDSFLEPIVEDMAEIGIDIWQGVLPTNDIRAISEKLDGRMVLMGGINSVIDREGVSEEEIRREVRRVLNAYGDLPNFIPSMTYGGFGMLFEGVEPVIHDEIARYNKERYGV